jgi:hypothetical protein
MMGGKGRGEIGGDVAIADSQGKKVWSI